MVKVTEAWVSLYHVVVKDKKLVVQEVQWDAYPDIPDNTYPFVRVPDDLSKVVGGYFFSLQTAQDAIMAVFARSVSLWNERKAWEKK